MLYYNHDSVIYQQYNLLKLKESNSYYFGSNISSDENIISLIRNLRITKLICLYSSNEEKKQQIERIKLLIKNNNLKVQAIVSNIEMLNTPSKIRNFLENYLLKSLNEAYLILSPEYSNYSMLYLGCLISEFNPGLSYDRIIKEINKYNSFLNLTYFEKEIQMPVRIELKKVLNNYIYSNNKYYLKKTY